MPNQHKGSWPADGQVVGLDIVVHRDRLDRITVVQVWGELDFATAGHLEHPLLEAIGRPGERLMIDLSECGFLDSAAIGSMMRARRALDRDTNRGPSMVVVANRPFVLRMLRLSGLDRIVPVIGDRHAAVDLLVQHV